MCGIFGYIGEREAAPLLLRGLKRLEYRGYDSAGISVLSNPEVRVVKKEGDISELQKSFDKEELPGKAGISHTRWATTGKVNDRNAHPHTSCDGEISIVHNGIIENAKELREELERKGHVFSSNTDSEVVAHLLEEVDASLEEAMMEVVNSLTGSFALVAIRVGERKLVGARKDSPLVVGISEEENFLASDVTPFLEYTGSAVFLEDNQVVVVEEDSFEVFDKSGNKIDLGISEIDQDSEEIELKGHDTYMHKEIYEQPDVVRNNLKLLQDGKVNFPNLELEDLEGFNRIIMTACGTSWHSCLIGEYMFEQILDVPVEVEYASEFRYSQAPLSEHDLVVGISQSGETADTLAALRKAKEEGATTLGVINVPNSTMAREVDENVFIQAGKEIGVASTKAFVGQITALSLLALKFYSDSEVSGFESRFLKDMRCLPRLIEDLLEKEGEVKELAEKYNRDGDLQNALFMGRGINFPTALEGALKLKEISYVHAEGYPAAEMKHGPIALIDDEMPSVFIANNGNELYRKVLNNIEEVKTRGGKIIAITDHEDEELERLADDLIKVPKVHPCLSPIVNVIPLQLFSLHMAKLRGLNVDKPRNLAKSVTVE